MTTRRKTAAEHSLTRRGFVTMVAAGSAVLLARPELAAAAAGTHRKKPAPPAERPGTSGAPAAAAAPSASQKEFDRQRAGTLATLKTLREHALPPGGDLPVVFRPQRSHKKGR